jgi:hypothetical protein
VVEDETCGRLCGGGCVSKSISVLMASRSSWKTKEDANWSALLMDGVMVDESEGALAKLARQ